MRPLTRTCPICEKPYPYDGDKERAAVSTAFKDDPEHKVCNDCFKKKTSPKK